MNPSQDSEDVHASRATLDMPGRAPAALFGPALVLMSGRALGFLAAFAVPLVLARLFDPQTFGTYKQLFLVYSTLFGIVQLGMAESLYYFLPSESDRKGSYILNAMLLLALSGATALLVLDWQRDNIAALLNNQRLSQQLPMIGIYLFLMLSALVLEIVMTAQRRHVAACVAYATSDLVRTVCLLVPVLAFTGLRVLLQGAVCFACARMVATLFYLKREFGARLHPDLSLLKKQLGYALPFGLAGLIEVVQVNYHMYVVSWYFDAATFAIYSVGCLQLPVTDFLMTSVSNVMMVNMRDQLRSGNTAAVHAIWLDAVQKLALALCPVVGVLLVLSHELITVLFTATYERSVPVFIVWTLAMLQAVLLTDGLLRVYAENRFLIIQNGIRLLLIAVFIQWFLQHGGLKGAVLVTLFAGCTTKLVALYRVKTLLGVRLSQLLPWKRLGATLSVATAAALPVLLLKSVLPFTGFPQLVLGGLVYLLSYCLLLWWYQPSALARPRGL